MLVIGSSFRAQDAKCKMYSSMCVYIVDWQCDKVTRRHSLELN